MIRFVPTVTVPFSSLKLGTVFRWSGTGANQDQILLLVSKSGDHAILNMRSMHVLSVSYYTTHPPSVVILGALEVDTP